MRALDALLLSFDHAWAHRWESLTAALDGVHPEEASWQSPAYRDAEPEAGWPLPGTLHWHVAHVGHCKLHYTDLVTQRDRPGRPPAPVRRAGNSYDDDVALLRHAHARQREALASLGDGDLPGRVGNGMSVAELVVMAVRHDVWHAGQIALARRLYRNR